jgi:phosphoribosylaminoimidazolecarboxamide formyltransferase/IMP cyclohydrolase/phosphoribosylaminoimidazolecarboxamide formyltransferase
MRELELKYGINPNQKPARIFVKSGELPIEVLNGRPGYINFLDALNGWRLVSELAAATGTAAAASFKHVSPAGAAIGTPLTESERRAFFAGGFDLSPIANAYIKARGADRMSSFGDWAALSEECDENAAGFLAKEVSDGIIAPSYSVEALKILKLKRGGAYNIVKIDPDYQPAPVEQKDVFGITFEQRVNDILIDESLLQNIVTKNKDLPKEGARDLIISLIVLKYTQSNSVCYAKDGQAIGIGAGQQSRIHCSRLAGNKSDIWNIRQKLDIDFKSESAPERDNYIDKYINNLSPEKKRELLENISDVSMGSDAFFPFADNIIRARQSGVSRVAQPGGSVRDDLVIKACDEFGIVMAFTGVRLFTH